MPQEEIGELLCPEDFIFVSVSQGSTWDEKAGNGDKGCNRKWGFDKINRVKRPKNPVLEFGKTGHKHAQNWLKKGTPPPDTPEGNTFKLGIKKGWLPAPKTKGVSTEEEFAREMHEIADDLLFIGYIDVVDVRNPDHVIVTDHKFTKDLRWMMTEEELADDIQAIGYARIVFDQTEAQKVTARWIYYCASQPQKKPGQPLKPRKPKAAKKVEHTFVRGDEFNAKWERFVEISRGIYHAKNTVKEAHELDANPRACSAYGGCPYAKDDPATGEPYCKIEDSARFAAHWAQFNKTNKKGTKNMGGLFDKLNKKAKAAATPEPESTEEPAAAAAAAPEKKKGSLSDRFGKMSAETQGNVVSLSGEAKVTPVGKAGGLNAAIAAKKNDGVNPPEQNEPDSDNDQTPETAAEKKKRVAKEKREQKKVDKEAAEAALERVTQPGGTPDVVVQVNKAGLTVFINCLPLKGVHTVQLTDLLGLSMEAVSDLIGEPHWNLAEYGKGPALLATAFDEWLDKNPQNVAVVVDSSSDESRAVREVLIAHATVVVRGVR